MTVRSSQAEGTPDLESLMDESIRRRRSIERRTVLLVWVGKILVPAVLLALREVAARAGWLPNDKAFYSRPSSVFVFLGDNASYLARQTWSTLSASLVGGALGFALGGVAGLLLGRYRIVDRILDPLIAVLNGLPRIALAPVFLLWLGITFQAKVFLAVSIVFFITLINVRSGVRGLDREYETVARLLGASSWKLAYKVVIPGIVPVLFGSLRLTLVFSVLGVIASEMVSARSGLGVAVVEYSQTLNPAGVFAVLAILAVIMAVFNGLIRAAESFFLKWQPHS
jgi:NitT/TauT family transport system permease protein